MRQNWLVIVINFFLLLMVAIFIIASVSCARYPSVPYADMDAAIATAATVDEREYYIEMRDKFERDVPKAEEWFLSRELCLAGGHDVWGEKVIWLCKTKEPDWDRRPLKNIDEMVRAYRKYRMQCGCASRDSLINGLGL